MKRIISVVVLLVLLVTTAFSVSAAVIGVGHNYGLQSWRYTNGVPDNVGIAPSGSSNAWLKTKKGFVNDKGEVISGATMKGIDVSEWNYNIDWAKVAKTDVDYAIIRIGYGDDLSYQDDKYVKQNIKGCVKNGIPFGVYIYSYALNTTMAKSEAAHVLRVLKTVKSEIVKEVGDYELNFPIFYDLEDNSQVNLGSSSLGSIAKTFCSAIRTEGYQVGIYANLNWWTNYLTNSYFSSSYLYKWVAQYNSYCYYPNHYDMWQCSSTGSVNGISVPVDLNFWYNPCRTKDYSIKGTTVSLNKTSYTVNRISSTQTFTLKASVYSPSGKNSVTWSTSDQSIATVSTKGVVTVKKRGNCKISATVNDGTKKTAKCTVTVKQLVTKVTLDKSAVTLAKTGKTKQLNATVKPSDANKSTVKWSSTNSKVAKVSQKGLVTAKAKGTCYIVAKSTDGSNKSAKCKITVVKQLVTKVTLDKSTVTLSKKGKTAQLKATVKPSNANKATVKWSSTNTKIAKVSQKGLVTAKAKGTCYVLVTSTDGSNKSAKCKIKVKN